MGRQSNLGGLDVGDAAAAVDAHHLCQTDYDQPLRRRPVLMVVQFLIGR